MNAFNVITDVQHNPCKEVKDQWKTYCQERRVDKEQPDFANRYIETLAQVGANPKGVTLKKGDYPLQHIRQVLIF